MKYVKVEWPDIQDYMNNPEYPEECYFDPEKNAWFIPDWWEVEKELENDFKMILAEQILNLLYD